MARGASASFVTFLLAAPLLSIIFIYVIHQVWFLPARIITQPSTGLYAAKFFIILLTIAALQFIKTTARPVIIGFVGSLLLGIYYAATQPPIPLTSAFLVFIVQWFMITLGVGLVDGFVKGYNLKGTRGTRA